jgi:hypothetical protein
MKQASVMLKENGQIWYSEGYIQEQIENAYQAGLSKGASIRFYAIHPFTEQQAIDYSIKFFQEVDKKYSEMYQLGKVIKKNTK